MLITGTTNNTTKNNEYGMSGAWHRPTNLQLQLITNYQHEKPYNLEIYRVFK
jgi:hypothetical protein